VQNNNRILRFFDYKLICIFTALTSLTNSGRKSLLIVNWLEKFKFPIWSVDLEVGRQILGVISKCNRKNLTLAIITSKCDGLCH
jgi:hypothetical protein